MASVPGTPGRFCLSAGVLSPLLRHEAPSRRNPVDRPEKCPVGGTSAACGSSMSCRGFRRLWQPVVKVQLHSAGEASPLTALLLPHIFPICSVVAPCRRGASPPSVRRWTFITGCWGIFPSHACVGLLPGFLHDAASWPDGRPLRGVSSPALYGVSPEHHAASVRSTVSVSSHSAAAVHKSTLQRQFPAIRRQFRAPCSVSSKHGQRQFRALYGVSSEHLAASVRSTVGVSSEHSTASVPSTLPRQFEARSASVPSPLRRQSRAPCRVSSKHGAGLPRTTPRRRSLRFP
jgi:hypothetical protein